MTTFDKREEAFERKFALDEEQAFLANARRTRMLGEWAAERLGRSGEDAQAYAREVVQTDFQRPGDSDVMEKLTGDFSAAGLAVTEEEIRAKSAELLAIAAAQIKAGN